MLQRSLSIPPLQSRNICARASQVVLAGLSLLASRHQLYRVHSTHLIQHIPSPAQPHATVCWWHRPETFRRSSCGVWCYVHGSDSPTPWVVSNPCGSFLTRVVTAYPGHSNSQCASELDLSWFLGCSTRLYLYV